jgi:hypothetical protein
MTESVDVRPAVVALAVDSETLLDLVRAGARDHAHGLARAISDRAAAVVDVLADPDVEIVTPPPAPRPARRSRTATDGRGRR